MDARRDVVPAQHSTPDPSKSLLASQAATLTLENTAAKRAFRTGTLQGASESFGPGDDDDPIPMYFSVALQRSTVRWRRYWERRLGLMQNSRSGLEPRLWAARKAGRGEH